jgi:hypothetical protein
MGANFISDFRLIIHNIQYAVIAIKQALKGENFADSSMIFDFTIL